MQTLIWQGAMRDVAKGCGVNTGSDYAIACPLLGLQAAPIRLFNPKVAARRRQTVFQL